MRKVFNNRQVTHVWAQQTQSEGRGPSIFFRDTEIFSYGTHYLAGKIYTNKKGKKFALINSHNYSRTTTKHLSYIRSAVSGLMSYFCVERPGDLKGAVKQLDENIDSTVALYMKRVKITSREDITWRIDQVRDAFNEANQLRKLLGLKEKPDSVYSKKVAPLSKHLHERLAAWNANNTPEKLAKKAAEKAKREAELAKIQEAKQAELIQRFRNGENVYPQTKYKLLRIQGDKVVTSGGAEVPLSDALAGLASLRNKFITKGFPIGQFAFETIENNIIKIGCHYIEMKEAENVLGGLLN